MNLYNGYWDLASLERLMLWLIQNQKKQFFKNRQTFEGSSDQANLIKSSIPFTGYDLFK